MEATSQQIGKRAEFLVFGELIKRGADLYLPIIDVGVDALLRCRDGKCLDLQVKSTEKGWSLSAWVPEDSELLHRRFILWVDMSKSKETPEIWIFPGKIFWDNSTKIEEEVRGFAHRRLDLGTKRRGDDRLRCEVLEKYRAPGAWHFLVGSGGLSKSKGGEVD